MENYDRNLEQRMYFVLREDIEISAQDCIIFGATATAKLAEKSAFEAPLRFAQYGKQTQPKICLRAKTIGQLEKAYQEAKSFQAIKIHDANNEFIGVVFGPVSRNEMHKGLSDFQIFNEFKTPKVTVKTSEWNPELPSLLLAVRSDIEIPAGKLIAQAGHGAFASIEANQNIERKKILENWREQVNIKVCYIYGEEDMMRLSRLSNIYRIPNAYIVDAGRTIFNQPTPTLIGIGPVTEDEYYIYDGYFGIREEIRNGNSI